MKLLLNLPHLILLNAIALQNPQFANANANANAQKLKHNRNRIKFTPPSPLIQASHAINTNAEDTSQSRRTATLTRTYQPLRIKFHTDPLLAAIQDADTLTKARGNAIITHVLPKIEAIWSQSLSIIPSDNNLVLPSNVCFDLYEFPTEWSKPKLGVSDTDLVIFVSALQFIGTTELCSNNAALSTLAVSSPCAIDPVTDRPVVGFTNVCLNTLAMGTNGEVDEESIRTMVDVMSHELVHVLGLNSELYKYFRNSHTGKLTAF